MLCHVTKRVHPKGYGVDVVRVENIALYDDSPPTSAPCWYRETAREFHTEAADRQRMPHDETTGRESGDPGDMLNSARGWSC